MFALVRKPVNHAVFISLGCKIFKIITKKPVFQSTEYVGHDQGE